MLFIYLEFEKHKTARVTCEYRCDRKAKLRKTENEWKKLVTTRKKTWRQERVGNVTLVHFFLNQQCCFEKLTLWNYLHLWTNQISVGHCNNWDVCKPCSTDVYKTYEPVLTLVCWQVNEREEDQITVASLQVTDRRLFCRNCLKCNNGKSMWDNY